MTVLCIRYIPVTLEGQKELDPPGTEVTDDCQLESIPVL